MFGQQNMLSLISSWNHCRRLSPLQTSNTLWAGFAFAQKLRSEFVEWSCTEMISTTPSCYCTTALQYASKNISPCFSSASYRCYSFKKLVRVQISCDLIQKRVKQKNFCMQCLTDRVCEIFSTNSIFPSKQIDFPQKRVNKLF